MNNRERQALLDLVSSLQHERGTLALKLAARTTELANVELDRESLRSMLKAQTAALKSIREAATEFLDDPDRNLWGDVDAILREAGL